MWKDIITFQGDARIKSVREKYRLGENLTPLKIIPIVSKKTYDFKKRLQLFVTALLPTTPNVKVDVKFMPISRFVSTFTRVTYRFLGKGVTC